MRIMKGRKEEDVRMIIHTFFFGYRNDKSCTKKIYRGKGGLSKKKCTDEGGLQTNQLKSENIVHNQNAQLYTLEKQILSLKAFQQPTSPNQSSPSHPVSLQPDHQPKAPDRHSVGIGGIGLRVHGGRKRRAERRRLPRGARG